MTKDEALKLQAVVDEILAQAVEKRTELGGAVNWADPATGAPDDTVPSFPPPIGAAPSQLARWLARSQSSRRPPGRCSRR